MDTNINMVTHNFFIMSVSYSPVVLIFKCWINTPSIAAEPRFTGNCCTSPTKYHTSRLCRRIGFKRIGGRVSCHATNRNTAMCCIISLVLKSRYSLSQFEQYSNHNRPHYKLILYSQYCFHLVHLDSRYKSAYKSQARSEYA